MIESWHSKTGTSTSWRAGARRGLDGAAAASRLHRPQPAARVLDTGDPYPDQCDRPRRRCAAARARAVVGGVQSAGRTSDPWLARTSSTSSTRWRPTARRLWCARPRFVSDHLEVLYDCDVEDAEVARDAGLALRPHQSLNDDPALCRTLADVVRGADDAASRVVGEASPPGRPPTRWPGGRRRHL